ncbi:hypothetical protein [Vulgatibacter incomptus]|uniref:Uncharacterized protein n=1 Tax=Vulgatibacter incomptus TaxID=1391653 RepID=A0A0K1P9C1_9BACT|nr:hypothetical protein [Vulgatibacter incomptus]AKU90133.1 hypothetical protein AKJ08_0520 [Vulgatibacter incomptus]
MYQSEFARKYIALGEARGLADGVISVLAVRGLTISAEQRDRLFGNDDPLLAGRWLDRAAEVDSADQLFD